MALNSTQINQLDFAIQQNLLPAIYFDFVTEKSVHAASMSEVENVIGQQLRSAATQAVKHGLANIIYWGYANTEYRDQWVSHFLQRANDDVLRDFQRELAAQGALLDLIQLKKIRLPLYSGMSSLSKVLTFLNPQDYCVLDAPLAQLKAVPNRALHQMTFQTGRQVAVTQHNQTIHNQWRAECAAINQKYFAGKYKTVEIQRGFSYLIDKQPIDLTKKIYEDF